ncbi:predicted protein [Histoplasma mississippiense (nom. inval.)]|uniref:predicted protein n=1 Tax=Ajellomyces capsulatus (strain NAm1 / WU24) TaxID=2059318 RepID=UPI000157B2A9|nr:predicted protein [Histoplasma mississippiense (nom. inval.)]EDN02274.1 predicted protein [Histoplasma mississippiense (nom. inval.)]
MQCGTPQGSPLSTILFLLYLAELLWQNSELRFGYADDLNICWTGASTSLAGCTLRQKAHLETTCLHPGKEGKGRGPAHPESGKDQRRAPSRRFAEGGHHLRGSLTALWHRGLVRRPHAASKAHG